MSNLLGFMRDTFYTLKTEYGVPIDVYKTQFEQDAKTGTKRIISRRKIPIRKAVMVPIDDSILAPYMAVTSADRRVGGYLENDDQFLIIDRQDLPKDFRFDEKDYVVRKYQGQRNRYEIKSLLRYDQYGLTVILRSIEGVDIGEVVSLSVRQIDLQFVQTVEGIVN